MRNQEILKFLKAQESWAIDLWNEGLEIQINGIEHNYRISNEQNNSGSFNKQFFKNIISVGLSGWDYKKQCSRWVGFDFDSIIGHKKGLTDNELLEIVNKVKEIPWITTRYSTSGKGLHLYVFFKDPPKSKTRKEHIQYAKIILSQLSALLNIDFKSKVDTAGTILWVWSTKAKDNNSFKLIKEGIPLEIIPKEIKESKCRDISATLRVAKLDEEQEKLLLWFSKQTSAWWWDAELNMLVCHTTELKRAHQELNLRGLFFTDSTGKDIPNDYNCFAFPLKFGSWIVRRFNPGCKEHSYWKTDKQGWTYCYFNRLPNLEDICPVFNGNLSPKGEYVFTDINSVNSVLHNLAPGEILDLPIWAANRQFKIKYLDNAKICITFNREDQDPLLNKWIANKKNWERVYSIIEEEIEITAPDELVRHVVSSNTDAGWYINVRQQWIREPKQNVYSALIALDYPRPIVETIIGQCILNSWILINQPFNPEYPGNRRWNLFSPQLLFEPKEGDWSKWKQILEHIGKNLFIEDNSWCLAHNIKYGWEYLKLWCASLFQFPGEPLPYIFLVGPQLAGKSTLHEALALLVNKGVVRADTALTNIQKFNAELAGAFLCVIEETNLSESKKAYDRIKDWTTSKTISIHEKGKTPFDLENTTHWIQCANSSMECPIKLGDTRITIITVDLPVIVEPKKELLMELQKQAPAFLFEILNTEIPPAIDRLRIPVIETAEKLEEQHSTANLVEQFILQECRKCNGQYVLFTDFYDKFCEWLKTQGISQLEWNKHKVTRSISLTSDMPCKGRIGVECNIALGNITFDKQIKEENWKYVKVGQRLVADR